MIAHGPGLLRRYHAPLIGCVVLLALSLFASVSHKIIYFDELSSVHTTGLYEMLSQATLVVSFRNGAYARLFVYVAMLALGLRVIVQAWVEVHLPFRFVAFYLVAIPGFFVEGLSVIGFGVPIFWFCIGVRPPRARVNRSPRRRGIDGACRTEQARVRLRKLPTS